MYCARACEQKSNSSRDLHTRSSAMEHIVTGTMEVLYIYISLKCRSTIFALRLCMCLLILVKVVMYFIPTFTYYIVYNIKCIFTVESEYVIQAEDIKLSVANDIQPTIEVE